MRSQRKNPGSSSPSRYAGSLRPGQALRRQCSRVSRRTAVPAAGRGESPFFRPACGSPTLQRRAPGSRGCARGILYVRRSARRYIPPVAAPRKSGMSRRGYFLYIRQCVRQSDPSRQIHHEIPVLFLCSVDSHGVDFLSREKFVCI